MNFVKDAKLDGDYLEFGVYKGNNFVEAYKTAKAKKLASMKFYAFDSFEGLPKIEGADGEKEFEQFEKGQYSFSPNQFKQKIKKAGVNLNDVEIISGWFNETLTQKTKEKLNIKSAAIVWVDCDLYESTVSVLKFITDYLVDGTILVFDDWFFFKGNPQKGEQRAFGEWLKKHPEFTATEFHKYFWHGNSFIINKIS